LEKEYTDEIAASDEQTVKLAVRSLLEVVESGSKNLEIAVLKRNEELKFLTEAELDVIVKQIEAEKAAAMEDTPEKKK